MKNWRALILALVLYNNNIFAVEKILDRIVAVVDNTIILESEIKNMLSIIKQVSQTRDQKLLNDATLRLQILDRLIMDNIILNKAKRTNISINDNQLDMEIGNIAKENNISINQLRRKLIDNGIEYNAYRDKIRKELLITEVLKTEIHPRITILPEEIESIAQKIEAKIANVTEFNLSHIFIPLPERSTRLQLHEAKTLAAFIIEQAQNGVDFDQLAMNYSTDIHTLKSGNIGWKTMETLPSIFAIHLENSQKNNIIGPIHSDIGFHILKINAIRNEHEKVIVNEIRARHILLRNSMLISDQEARVKLEDKAKQIKKGNISFANAAKELSEDFNSANQGGDLGWNSANLFDITFRNALKNLKKGEISAPIHSSFGWHLIQIIDTRQVDRTKAVYKERAYYLLFKRKFSEEMSIWMQEQRAFTYVKILDNRNNEQQ